MAVVSALAHVIVTEGLFDEDYIRERCDWEEFQEYAAFISDARHSPEATEMLTGVPSEDCARQRGCMRRAAMARSITASA